MTPPELHDDHVAAICLILAQHEVAFVVIGGVAARLHGTGHATIDPHADLLANVTTMTLITRHGPLDLCFTPAGFERGYDELAPRAITVRLANVDVPVASLEDIVESKRAAGRPKDITALPALEANLQRQRRS